MGHITKYQPAIKNLAGRILMEYTFYDKEEIVGFQLEMLANNHVPGVLRSNVIRVNEEIRLSYDITSMVSLKKFLERREIGRKDFFEILRQIIGMTEGLDEYLLDCGRVIFDNDFIFINPQNLQMEFVYLPLTGMTGLLEPLREFLTDVIIKDIRFSNEPADNYVQKLIEILKNREFKISQLKDYISQMENASVKAFRTTAASPVNFAFPKIESAAGETHTPPIKPELPEQTGAIVKTGYPTKSYIILFSVIGAFLLLGIVLMASGTFSANNPDILMSLLGYLIIGGAVFYLVYSKLFTPEKRIEKTIAAGKAGKSIGFPVINTVKSAASGSANPPGQGLSRKMEYVNKAFSIPDRTIPKAKQEAAPDMQTHTAILDMGSVRHPYLKRIKENRNESILLSRFPFMLGRMEAGVDYSMENPAVGKFHAEIKKNPDGYAITDMNSLNGTFLNGERLEPGMDYKVENGDSIILANEEFAFFDGMGG